MTALPPGAGRVAVPAVFAVATAVLLAAGSGPLATPPTGDLAGWLDDRGTLVAAMAVLRLLGLAAAAWLLVVTVVGEVAVALGATRLALASQRALPAVARRALGAAVGVGVLTTGVASVVGPSVGSSVSVLAAPAPLAHLRVVPDAPSLPPVRPVHEAGALATLAVGPPALVEPAVVEPALVEGLMVEGLMVEGLTTEEWTVEPGDSFWSIAAEVLADRLGRAPTDVEVTPYWGALVSANGSRLVGEDPDLIFPGQRLVLPG